MTIINHIDSPAIKLIGVRRTKAHLYPRFLHASRTIIHGFTTGMLFAVTCVMKKRMSFCLVPLLCVSATVFAQSEFGSMQGQVSDIDGLPIPGATVTASSSSLIGNASITYTDGSGRYRFPKLNPGNYELKTELEGFQTIIRGEVRVLLDSTTTVDFTLQAETVSETITVLGTAPLIDATTTATATNIPPEIIQNLPKPQNIFGSINRLLTLVPGVGDDEVAYGAIGDSANRIWIDGVDVSSPAFGNLYAEYNYNWIEEAQVTGIGAPAEYGGFTGVVGNFITRSGSNQFHGLVETFFQNEKFVSTNDLSPGPFDPFHSYDFSAQVGGPISRDKLWFFSGFQYPYIENDPFGYDGITKEKYPKFLTKLTYKPNQNNILQGFGHHNWYKFDGSGSGTLYQAAAGPLVQPDATSEDECSEASWNATWISLWSPQTTFEGRFGGFWADCKLIPRNGETPGHIDAATGVSSINALFRNEDKRFRPQVNVSLSHFADDFLGTHDFKFGVQFEQSRQEFQNHYNGGMWYYDYYGLYNRYSQANDFSGAASNNRISAYIQDNWNLTDRLTLSLGLRWDHNRGNTVDRGNVYKTDPVAPRVGIIWDILGGGKTILKVHYGDYYEALLNAQYRILTDRFQEKLFETYNTDTGEWSVFSRDLFRATSNSDFKQPLVRQFTVGVDHQLPWQISVGAHYIHRDWENILESIDSSSVYEPVVRINPITGEPITVFNRVVHGTEPILIANQPNLFRKYDGVELVLNRRFANKLAVSASFVYSRIRGNVPNIADAAGPSFNESDPNDTVNFEGRLVNDPTLAWKVAGAYYLPFGINIGGFFRHESGDTWAPKIVIRGLNQGNVRVFGLPRGSNRLPSTNILDMRVEKTFPISSYQFAITADIFNVLNSAYVTGVVDVYGFPTYGQPASVTDTRRIRMAVRLIF